MQFQLLTCQVALASDITQVVHRHEYCPVTYPELIVLQFLHGETAVTEIFDCGRTEDRTAGEEIQRLRDTYRNDVVDRLFPGHGITIPVDTERYRPRLVGTLVNPGPPVPPEPPVSAVTIVEPDIDPDIAKGPPPKVARDKHG